MLFRESLKTALNGLKVNKSRSLLTILGIVIGITAIIMIMSLGKGAEELILGEIRGMGGQTIAINPGRQPSGPTGILEMFTDSLTEKDVEALQNPANVPGIKDIMPQVVLVAPIIFENESERTTIVGGTGIFTDILGVYPEKGSIFTEDDIRQNASVVVLGDDVREKLFGDSDAVGQKVRIKDRNFRVIGVFPKSGTVAFFNLDEMALVPYSTAQKYLLGIDYFHEIDVRAENERIVPQVVRDIELTLRELHNIDDPDKDDFYVTTQADAMEMVSTVTGVLTLLLTAVAAISLVVGGIGIMNIMLVSVSERTREIGLRKAIGATYKDILTQFLLESVLLTAFGGLIGVFFGGVLSFLVALGLSKFANLNWDFVFPISSAVLGVGVAGAVGLFFGIFPARQAAKKSPIEALRYE